MYRTVTHILQLFLDVEPMQGQFCGIWNLTLYSPDLNPMDFLV